MKGAASVLGLLIVVAITWFVVKAEFSKGPTASQPPAETIDVAGVRSDLLSIGQAERMVMASHGSYESIDDLIKDGSLTFSSPNRRGYNYSATTDSQHFTVTAKPADPAKVGWPTLSIDD